MIELGEELRAEAPDTYPPTHRSKAFAVLALDGVFVAVAETDRPVGLLVGLMGEPLFSHGRYAFEHMLYVRPSFRGSSAALRLVRAFEDWAQLRGAHFVEFGDTVGGAGGFFEKLGYRPSGAHYRKEF